MRWRGREAKQKYLNYVIKSIHIEEITFSFFVPNTVRILTLPKHNLAAKGLILLVPFANPRLCNTEKQM